MPWKQLAAAALIVFVAATLVKVVVDAVRGTSVTSGDSAGDVRLLDDGAIVYYLHSNFRCETCEAIEACARRAVEEGFADELRGETMQFLILNYEQPPHEHYKGDFSIDVPMVVVVERVGGENVRFITLDDVWPLVVQDDKGGCVAYIQREINAFLEGRQADRQPIPRGLWLALGLAVYLGVLTSISPCPLAANIAAISYIGRRATSSRSVLLSGLLYTTGRTAVYVALGMLLATLVSRQFFSSLGAWMNQLMGVLLIVVAMFLLQLVSVSFGGGGVSPAMQRRVDAMGLWGALLLGVVFALTFCPTSFALFFLALVPLAAQVDSNVLVPGVYGVGTAVPVVVFAGLIAASTQLMAKAFNRLSQIERWVRWATGAVLLVIGIHLSLKYVFAVDVFSFFSATGA